MITTLRIFFNKGHPEVKRTVTESEKILVVSKTENISIYTSSVKTQESQLRT